MQRAAQRALAKASRATGEFKSQEARNASRVRDTRWNEGEFVAIDGEGFSDGPEFERIVGTSGNLYRGRDHSYAFIAASDGSELYSESRLSIWQCLNFVCSIVERNKNAILVAFGASYDVTHMVCHDLDQEQLATLLGKGKRAQKLFIEDENWAYCLEYRPRKCFEIKRWPAGEKRYVKDPKTGRWKATPHLTARLWDVWGFFQDSFVGVLKKWVPTDPDYEFIKRMKGERNIFERSEMAEIRRYNQAELRLLAKVMNRVRDAINDLGLKIRRWDGAGAIAAAMMEKHKVKDHKADLPSAVFEAARCAYSGGHIECCKVGFRNGPVHHYDVNSAYPAQFRNLPSLKHGVWKHGQGKDVPSGYTLVKLEWQFRSDLPFYPLFYRSAAGGILYPYRGSGWYWFSEFDVARRYYAQSRSDDFDGCKFEIKEWWHFAENTSIEPARRRPFKWVEDYYRARQDYIRAARAGGYESGPEKIIKLGCNSLYGKTAQQIGARIDDKGDLKTPPYFQLDWAGYVTAGCRAALMDAACQNPKAVIAFATDGLFMTEPVELYAPAEKELGAWEYQEHTGVTVVMPGVYWLHDGETMKHYSRGFDKREMSDAQFVHKAWARGESDVAISLRRMIGLGTAISSKDFWAMRGCFADSKRRLKLNGDNSKRYAINLRTDKPHKGLIDTVPRDHDLADIFGVPQSAPFPVLWLDGDGNLSRDFLEGEMADEMEAMDAALA